MFRLSLGHLHIVAHIDSVKHSLHQRFAQIIVRVMGIRLRISQDMIITSLNAPHVIVLLLSYELSGHLPCFILSPLFFEPRQNS